MSCAPIRRNSFNFSFACWLTRPVCHVLPSSMTTSPALSELFSIYSYDRLLRDCLHCCRFQLSTRRERENKFPKRGVSSIVSNKYFIFFSIEFFARTSVQIRSNASIMSEASDFFAANVPGFWNRRKYRVNAPAMFFVSSSEFQMKSRKIIREKSEKSENISEKSENLSRKIIFPAENLWKLWNRQSWVNQSRWRLQAHRAWVASFKVSCTTRENCFETFSLGFRNENQSRCSEWSTQMFKLENDAISALIH